MTRRRQFGAALIILLAILALGASWFAVTRLAAMQGDFVAAKRERNASVLAEAKRALVGYVAHQAAVSGENNPGAFLCPEAPGNIGGPNEGITAGTCALPAVGRLPWKTIGIEKLTDASGEPLWYVVANGWAKPNAGTNTVINSNCTDPASAMTCFTGQLTVDGQANAAVALIIAPGPAMKIQASAGCTARNQARQAPAPAMNPLDYLECYNTATSNFATTAPGTSFNDQVLKITASEVLPLIEGAVADRFSREFGAQMKAAYSGGIWPAAPVLPFAGALNGDVTSSPRTKLQGASGVTGGLLPSSYAFAGPCSCDTGVSAPCFCQANSQGQRSLELCNTSDPRCDSGFVSWRISGACGAANCTSVTRTAGASLHSYNCTVSGTPTTLTCNINGFALLVDPGMTINLDAVATNAGMTLRQASSPTATSQAPQITGVDTTLNSPFGYNITAGTLNSDGSATVRINARFAAGSGSLLALLSGLTCGLLGLLCFQYTISVPMAILADHALIDPTNSQYNWFYRNRWPEVAYYAIAPGIAPNGARSCSDTPTVTCLQVTYHRANNGVSDETKMRGILVLGGQKLATLDGSGNPYTQVRPATVVKDILDDINANGAATFEARSPTLTVNRSFNDHFAVIDKNP